MHVISQYYHPVQLVIVLQKVDSKTWLQWCIALHFEETVVGNQIYRRQQKRFTFFRLSNRMLIRNILAEQRTEIYFLSDSGCKPTPGWPKNIDPNMLQDRTCTWAGGRRSNYLMGIKIRALFHYFTSKNCMQHNFYKYFTCSMLQLQVWVFTE